MTANALRGLVEKTQRLADGFEALPAGLVRASADVVEGSIKRAIKTDAPRGLVAGGRVGVRDTTIRTGKNPAILVRAAGPLHLLANPTQPHKEVAKLAGTTRRGRLAAVSQSFSGARPMRTPYGPRYSVQHPGTRGKDTWRRGVDEGRPLISKAVQEAASSAVVKAFR